MSLQHGEHGGRQAVGGALGHSDRALREMKIGIGMTKAQRARGSVL